MTATAAEALELALWLHRAPARRAALLGRPLPDGIGQLLRVASGARDQVSAAATITGEDEATILEAVRFYLQQILFHEEADAYRVLGLSPDASHTQAREHHRLLQQWLHPDRRGADEWESVYATRINQAWGQLRTPQSRAAYDATLGAIGSGAASAGMNIVHGGNRPGGEWEAGRAVATPVASGPHNRSRNLALVVLVGCVGLLVLIVMRQETPPQWSENRPLLAETRDVPATPVERAPLATLGAALTEAMASPGQAATPPAPAAPPSNPAIAPAEVALVLAPVPATATPPRASFAEVAAASLTVPVRAPLRPAAIAAAPVRKVPDAPPHQTAAIEPEPSASLAAIAPVAVAVPPAVPVQTAASPPALPAASPHVPAPRAVPVQVPDAFGRMNQAQDRTRAVLAYLGDSSAGLPPVWNDVGTMQQAERIRGALHGRHGADRRVPLELQGAQWRLWAEGARLESRYRVGEERGRIDLSFTWRENQLLVSDISLDPDA